MNLSFFYKVLVGIAIISITVLCLFMHFRKSPAMIVRQGERGSGNGIRPKVLVVHSDHKDYGWTAGIDEGISRILDARHYEVETYYMDTKKRFSEAEKLAGGKEARQLADQWEPDIIITVDDNAQHYFAVEYASENRVPIVFCGVNRSLELYGYPGENVTGVVESPRYRQTVDLFKELMPWLKRTYVLTDSTESSTGVVSQILGYREYEGVELIKAAQVLYLEEWQEAVIEAGKLADLLVVYSSQLLFFSPERERVAPDDVLYWTLENSVIPVAGFTADMTKDAVLGGVSESSLEQGKRAAALVVEILKGKSPAMFPVETPPDGVSRLNIRQARARGMTLNSNVLDMIDIIVDD